MHAAGCPGFGWPVILVTVWLSCQNMRANCGGVATLPYLGRSFCSVAVDGHHDGCGCNVNLGNLTSLTILIVSQSFKACLGLLSEGLTHERRGFRDRE
ncbi:hypothetical protein ACFX13_030478 [Malus domestica]